MATPRPDGSPPPPEKYQDLGGSEFGSCFFTLEPLGPKYQYRFQRVARNRCPETLAQRLRLIAFSLNNILAFLRLVNRIGDPASATYSWPDDPAAFEEAVLPKPGSFRSGSHP